MGQCEICGKEIELPFRCNYCGAFYCIDHRLPENHQCNNLPKEPPAHIRAKIDPHFKYKDKPPSRSVIKSKKTILITLSLAIISIIFFFSYSNNLFSFQTDSSLSPTNSPHPTSILPLTPSATPNVDNQVTLVNYALSLINSDRQAHGLQNVTLSAVNSGQLHAQEMLSNDFFSHWDTNGYKPHMRYTLAGGKGAVSENIAWQGMTGNIFAIDVKTALENLEYSMMYDDASSNWGHRDNILNAFHNKVSIGIAYDSHNVYLVQDFENDYISWSQLSVNSNQVSLQGTIAKQGLTIKNVAIYYDKPLNLTSNQLESSPYDDSYGPGTFVGMALPENWEAIGGITITANTWVQSDNSFQFSFSLEKATVAYGSGVYTLFLMTGESTDSSLTTFSIFY